jgi:hypothetical protein
MDDLHVNGELTACIINNENTNAATTSLKGLGKTTQEVGLINDWDRLLDITSLSHGNN